MRLSLLLLCALLTIPVAGAAASDKVVAVDDVDITRYAGQWHEIARLPVSFQRRCAGDITAAYALREDGRIDVRNACRTHEGEQAVAEGVARLTEGHPGRLQVRFAPDWLAWVPMVWADYWIIALDPEYHWVMIGEPRRRYLWILSREPTLSRERFDALSAQAVAMGYDLAPLIVAGNVQ